MPVIAANGAELSYTLQGPTGAPVVAFSNSLGTTRAMWNEVVPHLRGRYRLLTYDTRGHGGSKTVKSAFGVGDLAADLAALLGALHIDKAHIVGLSLGGMTAQALAAAHPDRVLSLTLMATSSYMPSAASWGERAALVRNEGTKAIVDATIARWFTPGFPSVSPALVDPVREDFIGIDAEGYALCCEAIGAMDLRAGLAKITAPTMVIAGRQDPATPVAMAEQIASGIAGADLVVLSKAAHLLAVERGEAVAAYLLGFLDRQARPARSAGGAPFEAGLLNRKAVLGEAHVERSLAGAGDFAAPWQHFITRTAWGEVWGDPALPWKTRSLVTLAMMVALHREEEFKLHLRPALGNGVSIAELQALLLHSAIYAGVPAANGAFRWAKQVLGEELA